MDRIWLGSAELAEFRSMAILGQMEKQSIGRAFLKNFIQFSQKDIFFNSNSIQNFCFRGDFWIDLWNENISQVFIDAYA